MSYGITAYNANDELCLVLLDDAKHMHYLGTATYDSDTSTFTGWASNLNQGTRYLISSPGGPPLVFIQMVVGSSRHAIQDVSLVSGDTYAITIWDTQGVASTRSRPTIHCFGYLTTNTPADAYGIQLYDTAGNVVTDTTRGPLIAARVFTQAASAGNNTPSPTELSIDLTGMATPAINFHANGRGFYIQGSGSRTIVSMTPAVVRHSTNTATSTWFASSSENSFGGGQPNGCYLWSGAMTCLVVDMAKYL